MLEKLPAVQFVQLVALGDSLYVPIEQLVHVSELGLLEIFPAGHSAHSASIPLLHCCDTSVPISHTLHNIHPVLLLSTYDPTGHISHFESVAPEQAAVFRRG